MEPQYIITAFRNNVLREIAVYCEYKEALSCDRRERAWETVPHPETAFLLRCWRVRVPVHASRAHYFVDQFVDDIIR